MHPRLSQVYRKYAVTAGLLILVAAVRPARADDPGFLGRLFRLGGSSPSGTDPAAPNNAPAPLPYSRGSVDNPSYVPSTPTGSYSGSASNFDALSQTPATAPLATSTGPGQRLSPQPRFSSSITNADPVLTRFALGRSNDGSQFGMFLQVFADGTVVDSEGVHRLRGTELRPIVDVVQSGELYRLKGHCGAPATDFIEYVHIVVYERRLGRLAAHSFSYSGNPQGCDPAIRHIHAALENLQAKLSRQPAPAVSTGAVSGSPVPLGNSPIAQPGPSKPVGSGPAAALSARPSQATIPTVTNPATVVPTGPVIPLTPIGSPR
jgi:hypothetical protein